MQQFIVVGGGGGVFNNQTGPILVHIYPLINIKTQKVLIKLL